MDYLAELNPEQRRAVEHGVSVGWAPNASPLLVIAGAGSGKTKTLAYRVAHLVVNTVDPQRILLLTFSRRAALDMIATREAHHRGSDGGGTVWSCPGPAPSTRSARASCGNTRCASGSIRLHDPGP